MFPQKYKYVNLFGGVILVLVSSFFLGSEISTIQILPIILVALIVGAGLMIIGIIQVLTEKET